MTVKETDKLVRESDKESDARQDVELDLTQPLPPEPGLNIGWLLGLPMKAIDRPIHKRLDEAGFGDIRPAHSRVFETVSGAGSRITDMADEAALTKQSMQYLVDDLERLGYAERIPDPADRRAKLVRLTPRGRESVLVARRAIAELEKHWSEELGPRKYTQLRRLLEELVELVGGAQQARR